MPRLPAILLRIGFTVGLIALGWIGMVTLIATGPKPKQRPAVRELPVIETITLTPTNYGVQIPSQGIILPRNRSQLTAEVSGKITHVSPNLLDGAEIQSNEILVELDDRDYLTNLSRAEAALTRAKTAIQLAQAQSDRARSDWKRLGRGSPSALTLKLPQLEEAKANLQSAEADLADAKLDVERCQIRAPYSGRIIRKNVDIGQFVSPGSMLAELFSTDAYEVRLPLRIEQLSFLRPGDEPGGPGKVDFFFEGQLTPAWTGDLARTDAEIDSRSRQLFVIAAIVPESNSHPLASGTFVEAKIEGKTIERALVIPREAVKGQDTVLRVLPDNTIKIHPLDIIYAGDPDHLIASTKQIPPGPFRISKTPLPFVSNGDQVTIQGQEPSPGTGGNKGKGKGKGQKGKRSSSPDT